jgi:hypothetical protein
MSDKKLLIKVSELRALIREALGETPSIASRQSMMNTADDDEAPDLSDGKGKEQLNDVDEVVESAKSKRRDIVELNSYEQDFAEKLTDKKYTMMAQEIFNAWASHDTDVDWAGVVNLFARNHSKNLGQEVDKTKLYEKVLDLVEKNEEKKSN